MFCLEYLEKNVDWLEVVLTRLRGHYVLLDCPGQAELYTHHGSFFSIVQRLQKLDFRVSETALWDTVRLKQLIATPCRTHTHNAHPPHNITRPSPRPSRPATVSKDLRGAPRRRTPLRRCVKIRLSCACALLTKYSEQALFSCR